MPLPSAQPTPSLSRGRQFPFQLPSPQSTGKESNAAVNSRTKPTAPQRVHPKYCAKGRPPSCPKLADPLNFNRRRRPVRGLQPQIRARASVEASLELHIHGNGSASIHGGRKMAERSLISPSRARSGNPQNHHWAPDRRRFAAVWPHKRLINREWFTQNPTAEKSKASEAPRQVKDNHQLTRRKQTQVQKRQQTVQHRA